MKLFSVLFVILSASAVFAMPAVNDHVVYDMTATSGGMNMTGTLDQKLTSFDATAKQFQMTAVMTMNGQAGQPQIQAVNATDLMTDAQLKDIITNCAAKGGTPEKVTVAAGTFDTCAAPVDDPQNGKGTINFGDVAFGIVKADLTNASTGMNVKLSLKTSTKGQ